MDFLSIYCVGFLFTSYSLKACFFFNVHFFDGVGKTMVSPASTVYHLAYVHHAFPVPDPDDASTIQ